MSENWVKDIAEMHQKFGVKKWIEENKDDKIKLLQYLRFRLDFLYEELKETENAFLIGDSEEFVDGLIDLCVVAIGTLDAVGVDTHSAWNEVLRANMSKKVGVKPTRPNPLQLPDLMKPDDWIGPKYNESMLGYLPGVFCHEK